MTTQELFRLFCQQNTNGRGRKERRYIETYGDIPFEEAFPIYLEGINIIKGRFDKIRDFENFLIAQGCKRENSNISESRYYIYNGIKYRFSGHIYPTGSMTNELLKVVDLAADPELIDNIKF